MTPLAYLSNGEVTSSTPGWASKRSTLASISFRIAAVRTLCPGGTTTINCAVVPLAWGKVRLSESRAIWDSVPGSLDFLVELPAQQARGRAEDDQHREPGQQYGAAASGGGTTEAVEER